MFYRKITKFLIILSFFFVSGQSLGARLSDYPNYNFEVRFTNPDCQRYYYEDNVFSNEGDLIRSKPKDVYCTFEDYNRSANRRAGVQYKLVSWIRNIQNREIFFSSLSFSNSQIRRELCSAANRGVKIRFVLDSNTNLNEAYSLVRCGQGDSVPRFELRGDGPGSGYSHNKFFIFNPQSRNNIRIVFSSGNVSSGTVLHHETWNFLETSVRTHLAQKQICLMNALWEVEDSSRRRSEQYLRTCINQITTEEEEDVQLRILPLESKRSIRTMVQNISQTRRIGVAAHRFSLRPLVRALSQRLRNSRPVRLIVDDDVYWTYRDDFDGNANTLYEWNIISRLYNLGLESRFLETNHWSRLYQHNRMIIFDRKVLTGSANWTNAAFNSNFESLYWIQTPKIVRSYQSQFEHLWNDLATRFSDLPVDNSRP